MGEFVGKREEEEVSCEGKKEGRTRSGRFRWTGWVSAVVSAVCKLRVR
jgi:hypothetical protein